MALAKENFLIAAELGVVWSAQRLGDLLGESSPARWIWWSRAAWRGGPAPFLDSFTQQVESYFNGFGGERIIFFIGRALKGNIDTQKKEI